MACGDGCMRRAGRARGTRLRGLGRPWRLSEAARVSHATATATSYGSGPRATCIRAGRVRLLLLPCGRCGVPHATRVPRADAALRNTRSLNYV